MATIDLRTNQASASTAPTVAGNIVEPFAITYNVDLAAALAAKGSALAAADVLTIGTVPAGWVLLGGTSQVTLASDATTITYNVGLAGGSTAVSGQSGTATGYAGAGLGTEAFASSASTLTVTLATLTGTATVGKLTVNAIFLDISKTTAQQPGIAQPKS